MIIVLMGASGTGKSMIENEVKSHYNFKKIVPYTTRKPRPGEVNGKDYYFISNNEFNEMINLELFAEHDEYPQGSKYGTLKADYADGNRIVVLTPNGLMQLNKKKQDNIFIVLIKASLGTRIKRYIDRIGVGNFNYDDKNEIASRVERDYSMFLSIERECDIVIQNEDSTNIKDIAREILKKIGYQPVEVHN